MESATNQTTPQDPNTAPAESAPASETGNETAANSSGDGTTSPPPVPTPNPIDTPPAAPKVNPLKKLLPFLIVAVLLIVVGGAGFFVGKSMGGTQSPKEAEATTESEEPEEATSEAVLAVGPVAPTCVSGYKPFVSPKFSICYPVTMKQNEEQSGEDSLHGEKFVFEDDVETLTVYTDYKGNLNGSECVSSKVIKIAGISAQRYLIKDKNRTSCGSTIAAYATLVSLGNDKPIFNIGLTKKSGSYLSDNNHFIAIEGTFLINGN